MPNNQKTIGDIVTVEEIKLINKIMNDKTITNKALYIAQHIIEPNIDRINKNLEQENDPKYLGYMIEYMFKTYCSNLIKN